MSEQIKKWCDAIMFHEDDLDLGTCKTLKMITDEARRLTAEIERLQVDLHQTFVDCEKYKSALKKIARGKI